MWCVYLCLCFEKVPSGLPLYRNLVRQLVFNIAQVPCACDVVLISRFRCAYVPFWRFKDLSRSRFAVSSQGSQVSSCEIPPRHSHSCESHQRGSGKQTLQSGNEILMLLLALFLFNILQQGVKTCDFYIHPCKSFLLEAWSCQMIRAVNLVSCDFDFIRFWPTAILRFDSTALKFYIAIFFFTKQLYFWHVLKYLKLRKLFTDFCI